MNLQSLPSIDAVHIKYPRSKKQAIAAEFATSFRKNLPLNIFLACITCGIFCYHLKKKSKSRIVQAIIARKISCIIALIEAIKEERAQVTLNDPRQAINAIFMKIAPKRIEHEGKQIEFRAIYTPAEMLLFITNPIRNLRQLRLRRHSKKKTDYIQLWQEIKKKSKVNQFRQIHTINFYTKYIKEEFLLSSAGIHDRMLRSSVYKKSAANLTMFKELSLALLEIVVAYEDFGEFKHANRELYHFIKLLSETSELDIKKLEKYMETGTINDNLSAENRRQLIQLGNRQQLIYNIGDSEVFDVCALILNSYQWQFLLSLQKTSDVSLNLLNWAYEQTPNVIEQAPFSEKLLGEGLETLEGHQEDFKEFFEAKGEAHLDHMLRLFASEKGGAWPLIEIITEHQLFYKSPEHVSLETPHLIETFTALERIADGDINLLFLLQKALTGAGKGCFEQAIEEGVVRLLGEKCEFFIPILSNTKVVIFKHDKTFFTLTYSFSQAIYKQGDSAKVCSKQEFLEVKQDIHFVGEAWNSNPAEVSIKGGMS